MQYQQPLPQSASHLPFQQQQQLAYQHVPLSSRHGHHSVPAQESVSTARGHLEAQQLPKPGFTPDASFRVPLQAPQQSTGPTSGSRGGATAWAAQPPSQPVDADAVPVHSAGQQTVQTQKGPADCKLPGTNASDILGQQASMWRQAASKPTLLADLVPATERAAGTSLASQDAPVSAEALMQPAAVLKGCAGFKPAVQACIAAAGLPLAKPFYQQAVEHAMEQHTRHKAVSAQQKPNHLADVKHEALDVGAPNHSMQKATAPADDGSVTAIGANHQHVVDSTVPPQQQQLAQRAASPAPSSNSDLGTDLPDKEAKTKARTHMSVERWDGAHISGKMPWKQICPLLCLAKTSLKRFITGLLTPSGFHKQLMLFQLPKHYAKGGSYIGPPHAVTTHCQIAV